ncbi:MAG: hypothetical protein ACXWRA_13580 [Pseudobdellovibrionaceae bacterium]
MSRVALAGGSLEILPMQSLPIGSGEKPSERPAIPELPPDLQVSPVSGQKQGNWFPWNPTGMNNRPASNYCSKDFLRDQLWLFSYSVAAQGKAVNDWIHRCNKEISSPYFNSSSAPLMKYATVSYEMRENPHIRMIKATLPDGRKLTGLLAMKPDDKPRPFIIAKCGIYCNSEQSTTQRAFMMHLFDESPFHVLALANNTGSDFQIDNQAFSLGGFDEGRQLYEIAQLLRSPESPIRHRISSVHVMGSSLGGNAALYAGLYASLNPPPDPYPDLIQSVTAICPVVVLENSGQHLFLAQPISTVASFETIHHIRGVYSFVPVLGHYFPGDLSSLKGKKLYDKVMKVVVAYYKEWTSTDPWDLKPFTGVRIDSLAQFWRMNDFRNYVSQVNVPTMTISSDNDAFIKSGQNGRLLELSLLTKPNDKVGNIFFSKGNHCAFSIANGWANYSTLQRDYILSHSPEAKEHWKEVNAPLPQQDLDISSHEKIVEAEWMAHAGDDQIRLRLKLSGVLLSRNIDMLIPLSSLPVSSIGTPHSTYDVNQLNRLANTRFSVVDEKGELVTNTNHIPKYIKAWDWE